MVMVMVMVMAMVMMLMQPGVIQCNPTPSNQCNSESCTAMQSSAIQCNVQKIQSATNLIKPNALQCNSLMMIEKMIMT
eukprot:289061-Karenia_brevis.AAC.1